MKPVNPTKEKCPTNREDCRCKFACATLYGQEVRSLRKEVLKEEDGSRKDRKYREWQTYINKYARKI